MTTKQTSEPAATYFKKKPEYKNASLMLLDFLGSWLGEK